ALLKHWETGPQTSASPQESARRAAGLTPSDVAAWRRLAEGRRLTSPGSPARRSHPFGPANSVTRLQGYGLARRGFLPFCDVWRGPECHLPLRVFVQARRVPASRTATGGGSAKRVGCEVVHRTG